MSFVHFPENDSSPQGYRSPYRARRGHAVPRRRYDFKLNLFPFLPIIIRFWEADDEFPASLQILADRNTLDYMHYETLMFALTHLFSRLNEEMRNEKR